MCYCIIVYIFRYRDIYIWRSPVDQCFHVLLNKYVFTPNSAEPPNTPPPPHTPQIPPIK